MLGWGRLMAQQTQKPRPPATPQVATPQVATPQAAEPRVAEPQAAEPHVAEPQAQHPCAQHPIARHQDALRQDAQPRDAQPHVYNQGSQQHQDTRQQQRHAQQHASRQAAQRQAAQQRAQHQAASRQATRSGAGEMVRRVLVFTAFTLVVAGLVLMWFSLTSGPTGWQLTDPYVHAWAMALGATGIGLLAVVWFGVATILRSVLAVTGLGLGLLAANSIALDAAVLRWAFIIIGGIIGWLLGAGITKACGAMFGRG